MNAPRKAWPTRGRPKAPIPATRMAPRAQPIRRATGDTALTTSWGKEMRHQASNPGPSPTSCQGPRPCQASGFQPTTGRPDARGVQGRRGSRCSPSAVALRARLPGPRAPILRPLGLRLATSGRSNVPGPRGIARSKMTANRRFAANHNLAAATYGPAPATSAGAGWGITPAHSTCCQPQMTALPSRSQTAGPRLGKTVTSSLAPPLRTRSEPAG